MLKLAGKGMAELIYLVFFSPTKGLREVVSRRPIGWAIILVVIYSLINALVFQQIEKSILQQLGEASPYVPASVLFSIISGLISFFFSTGVWHIIARFLKGRGGYIGLLCGVAFASLPTIFLAPLTLITLYLPMPGLLILSLSTLVISFWILVLTILAIKYSYNFSTLRAIATFILPVPAIFLLAFILSLILRGGPVFVPF